MKNRLFYYVLVFAALSAIASSCAVGKPDNFIADESEMILISDLLFTEDVEMQSLIAPYKARKDRVMSEVIGYATETMDAKHPESALPQFILKIMMLDAEMITGKKIDVALINLGGLRSPLYKGKVTIGAIYSVFPFENALTQIQIKGRDLKALYKFNKRKKMLAISPLFDIKDEQDYQLVTTDYLVDVNGKVSLFKTGPDRIDTGVLLRDLIINYYRSRNLK